MKRKLLLGLLFLIGVAVGQTSKNLSMYGCTERSYTHSGTSIYVNQTVCIVYDPNLDKHFVVSSLDSGDGVSTSIVEER